MTGIAALIVNLGTPRLETRNAVLSKYKSGIIPGYITMMKKNETEESRPAKHPLVGAKRLAIWLLYNGGMCYLAYLALFLHQQGPANVLRFLIIFNLIVSVLAAFSEEIRKKMQNDGPSIHPKINLTYEFAFVGILVYFGWFWYGGFSLFGALAQASIWGKEYFATNT